MTSTTKPTKENKPYSSAPRLLPRPTAASAARAARNATNRNIVSTNSQKGSPTRNPANPVPVRSCHATKSNCRNVQKTDSKSEVKTNPANDTAPAEETVEIEIIKASCDTLAPMEDQYLIPDNVQEDIMEEHPSYPCSVGILEDIKENKILETVSGDERSSEFEDAQNTGQIEVIEKPVSRPQSPMLTSRPQTPKSMPKSRPQTPRTSSRPTTPSPFQVPPSRPNTPQRSVTRPSTPSRPPTPKKCNKENKAPPSNQLAINKEEGDVKTVFIMKQKQFHRMKKELDMKQREILDMFDNLRNLRDRMTREGVSGCGEGHLNELVMFNVADWTSEEIAQLCQAANGKSTTNDALDVINTAVPIDDRALAELDANVSNVPACFADLCLQAFTARQELIDWVKELIENNAIREENDSGECLERIAQYNTQGLRMCDALRELKNKADDVVCTLSQLSRRACRERSALVMVGESLIREIARLQQDTQGGEDSGPEHKVLERVRSELEEEKAASAILKDKLATTETHLRQARGRINKMDRQLREAETSIASLTGTVKTLEDQSRQKEVQLEARARKLKESLKSGEFTSGQLTQQRDALQAEIILLKEQIEAMQSQHKTTTQELTNKIKDLKTTLDEQTKLAVKETEDKKSLELALAESKNTIEELNAKIHKLENSLPNPDLPTEREMDLWAQLQATKDTLRLTEDEIASCKKEKIRFLETLTKIAETDNKVGMQQKLAAELLSKEEIMGKMQCQIRELTKNIKLNEQKVLQYEQYVRDLQDHNRAVANCQETPNGISYQDLQHEIMNLKMSLLDQVHRNEELSEILVQKEQHIDQQDKTSRAQARVIKVREELINMLKNKETEQSRELTALQQDLEHRMKVVDEVNKQIASKADEIQELFSTLENKQQQIHRLEKIVLALEEQQRRAQAQRTRHEEKIAALEHELAAGNRRERKFLFF